MVRDGGVEPSAVAQLFAILMIAAAGHLLLAAQPFSASRPALWISIALGGGLATWAYASRGWSGAPSRSSIEVALVLLYVVAVGYGGLALRTDSRRMWAVRLVALTFAVTLLLALMSRVAPGLIHVSAPSDNERLAWPISYWNALGVMAAVSLVTFIWLAGASNTLVDRVASAAAIPLAVTVMVLTFSRGAAAASICGVLVLGALQPRRMVVSLVAAAPAAACAATVLSSERLTGHLWEAAHSEAHRLALVVVVAMAASGLLRLLVTPLDDRLQALPALRRGTVAGVAIAITLVGGVGFVAAGGPSWIDSRASEFSDMSTTEAQQGQRFTTVQNNGRVKMWRAARSMYESDPLRGTGAGTYAVEWNQYRGIAPYRVEAHSLYLQTLGELGIVGGVLLGGFLLSILGALLALNRAAPSASLAAGTLVTCGVAAAFDWTWMVPAITVPVLAFCGMAMARDTDASAEPAPRFETAARAAAVLVLVGVTVHVARVGISEARLVNARTAVAVNQDCIKGMALARAANAAMERPEALALEGTCYALLGRPELALERTRQAERVDPRNWLYPYLTALLLARVHGEPAASLRRAAELDPSGRTQQIANAAYAATPKRWASASRDLRAPYP
jgi:O-Antigen ligase